MQPLNKIESVSKVIQGVYYLLAFVIATTLWYGSTNARLSAVEAKQTQQEEINKQITQMSIDLAVTKNTVLDIKQSLKDDK